MTTSLANFNGFVTDFNSLVSLLHFNIDGSFVAIVDGFLRVKLNGLVVMLDGDFEVLLLVSFVTLILFFVSRGDFLGLLVLFGRFGLLLFESWLGLFLLFRFRAA